MNFQKENEPSNSQNVKELLAKILNEYKVDSLKYMKNKKIFKGEYLLYLKQSQKILFFLQTTNENSLHFIELNEEMVLKSTKINLKFLNKGGKIEFEVKKILVSADEKLISFVGKQHIAIIEMRSILNNKDNRNR
jgi:hypothetical protein